MMLQGSLLGIGRVAVGFPLEHPIDAIKVQWQAQPHFRNEIQITKHILESKGLKKGLYAGSLPNFMRLVCRNSYKYPLLIGLPEFYKTNLPEYMRNHESLLKLATGLSIALIETTITCPIERTKVYFMTQKPKGLTLNQTGGIKTVTYSDFFKQI